MLLQGKNPVKAGERSAASLRAAARPGGLCRLSSLVYYRFAVVKSMAATFNRIAVIGAGPVGSLLAGHLALAGKTVFLIDSRRSIIQTIREQGLTIQRSERTFTVRPRETCFFAASLERFDAELIVLAVKSYHLETLLAEVERVFRTGQKVVIAQNGIDTEERAADLLGPKNVFRAVINYAGMILGPGVVRMTFFNPPNYVGALVPERESAARKVADLFTAAGLETLFTPEIKTFEWIKTILAAGLMPVCATTGLNMQEAMDCEETRYLCEQILAESIAVASKLGIALGENFYEKCLSYLSSAGSHKPSVLVDLEAGNPVEYVFQPIIDYGKKLRTPTPVLESLTKVLQVLEKRQRNLRT
jgi:2-dehydropantoate 2-reductase